MKKTIVYTFTLTLVLCLVLSSCAPAEETVQTEEQPKEEEEVVVETPKEEGAEGKIFEGREITFMAGAPQQVADREIAKWFEEETGAHVNVLVVPYENIIEKATLDVTSGAGEYDVIQYWYPGLGSLVKNGVLADVTDMYIENEEEFDLDDVVPAFLDTYTMIDGKRYGVPLDGDIHLLFYNTTIFDKYNLEPPKTWEEYVNICKQITEAEAGNDVYGCGIMATKVPFILIGTFLNRVAGFGGSFFDEAGNPTINSPENVAALENLIAALPYAIPDPRAVGFDEMLGVWVTGRVGMVEFWTDLGQMTDNPEESMIVGQWDVAPMPVQGEKGKVSAPMNAGWGVGMSTMADDVEVAKAFLEFIMRPDISLRANLIVGGFDPVRYSTFDDPAFREHVTPKLAEAAKFAVTNNAVPWPTYAEWWELQDVLNENIAMALNNEKTAKQALDDTQVAWENIMAK